jgi:hypothetical protein
VLAVLDELQGAAALRAAALPGVHPRAGDRLSRAPARPLRTPGPAGRRHRSQLLGRADAVRVRRQPRRAVPGQGRRADVPVFNLRELVPVLRGRYADRRLTLPTRMCSSEPTTQRSTPTSYRLRGPRRRHGDRVRPRAAATSSPTSGPDLVAKRARALFAG